MTTTPIPPGNGHVRRHLLVWLLILAAGGGLGVLLAQPGDAASGSQCVRLHLGGRTACLAVGKHCSRRYQHVYLRHGFTCSQRTQRLRRHRVSHSGGGASTTTVVPPTTTAPPTTTVVPPTTTAPPTTIPAFSCPTEPAVTRQNDCPPADPANPPADFCSTHSCSANFYNGSGTAVQCNDGEWSMSGGIRGACSYHGGESDNPPGPPPIY